MNGFPKHYKNKFRPSAIGFSLMLLFILVQTENSQAQLYPLGAQYFDNRYIGNPSMAGIDQGMRLNLAFRKQWSDIHGAPMTQSISGDYGNNKLGLGLNIYNDMEGLLHNTHIGGTLAYHLPFNDQNKQFHFGMSVGLLNQQISTESIVGDHYDPSVRKYNDEKSYIDADFGMSYTSDKLSLQASIPNMKSFFSKDYKRLADLAIFYTAVSYKINLTKGLNATSAEPMICYRGVKGFDSMWDVGSNLTFTNNRFNLQGMYHSTGSGSFGFGFNYNSNWRISSTYTTATSALRGFTTTGDFEINLKLSL